MDNAESFSAPPEHAYEAALRTLLRPEEVWEIIREIGLMERHFHQMQHHYRLLASTWILAVFAAAGFLLARNELYLVSLPKDVAIPKELAIAMLTIFGGIGITLLWIMDLRIYGMLLRGVFNTGMELEKKYGWLPPVRTKHIREYFPRGDVQFVRWWYIGANAIVLLLGDVFFSAWCLSVGGLPYLGFSIVFTGIILAWCYCLRSKKMLRETSNDSDR